MLAELSAGKRVVPLLRHTRSLSQLPHHLPRPAWLGAGAAAFLGGSTRMTMTTTVRAGAALHKRQAGRLARHLVNGCLPGHRGCGGAGASFLPCQDMA